MIPVAYFGLLVFSGVALEKVVTVVNRVFPNFTPLRWVFGKLGSRIALPAQDKVFTIQDAQGKDIDWEQVSVAYAAQHGVIRTQSKVTTADGVVLDTMSYRDSKHQNPVGYMIQFCGNAARHACYYQDLVKRAKEGWVAIGFDFRHVANSQKVRPSGYDDLVKDGIAQVESLLKQGINPRKIVLNGHSLGGGIAVLVAEHFHKRTQPVPVYVHSDRSFAQVTDVPTHLQFRGAPWYKKLAYLFLKPLYVLVYAPLVRITVKMSAWEIRVLSAYKSIPEGFRSLSVVNKDHRIPRDVSLYREIKWYKPTIFSESFEQTAARKAYNDQFKVWGGKKADVTNDGSLHDDPYVGLQPKHGFNARPFDRLLAQSNA